MLCKVTHPNENEKLGVCEKNGPNFPHSLGSQISSTRSSRSPKYERILY
jgi:hypothetical protein